MDPKTQKFLDFCYEETRIGDYLIRFVKVGNGPNVIFGFPGLVGSIKDSYGRIIEQFKKKGQDKYTFYSWDQPGYFGSQPMSRKEDDINFMADVEMSVEFIKSRGHSKCTLMGWSAGGQLCLLFAMRHPEMVERILIWGAWDRLEGIDLERQIWFRNVENFEKTFLKDVVESNGTGYDSYVRHWHAWIDWITLNYSGDMDLEFWTSRLKRIQCPLLILWGEQDNIVSRIQSEFINQHTPNSRLDIIPRAPHWIQIVYPQIIYSKLEELMSF